MHDHPVPKLLLLVAALSLAVGAASVQGASAASETKACIKQNCKTPKKNSLKKFKEESKSAKADCKAKKKEDLGNCAGNKQCKKEVKRAFKQCKKETKLTLKESKAACKTGFKTCKSCCKTVATGCSIVNCGDGIVVEGEECDDQNVTDDDGCDSNCTPTGCGNNVVTSEEECDTTLGGCSSTALRCVAPGDFEECTCAEPCQVDPLPTKLRFTTQVSTGDCGCTLESADATTCGSPIGDLECGALYLGGGLSSVPPGPAPDGATNFVEFPECRGERLIVGPSAGTSEKDCTFGAEEPGGPCRYGPALSIENTDAGLSTCVLNTLRENVEGWMNPTTGHSSMRVELTSRVFLTGDMIKSTCVSGPMDAAPCARQGAAKRGGTCDGGPLQNAACATDADCEGGTCSGICGACSNGGAPCQDDSDCTGGSCIGLCADEAEGECDDSGEPCRLKGVCDGPANPGLACDLSKGDEDCSGSCVVGGKQRVCSKDSQCGGGTCEPRDICKKGTCIGGGNAGHLCTDDSDCGGGTCGLFSDCPSGTCEEVGRPVQPCPTCVDESFNPVTDGAGTCNLGARKDLPCVSTNSLGLTIDCLPIGGPEEEVGEGNVGTFLADIDVTIPAFTTGKAEMIADADGTFCNFGYCVEGRKDGEECGNSRDCPGGTCQKYCQVLGGPDAPIGTTTVGGEPGTDPDGDPTCETQDDCLEAGVTGWRPCGQNNPGAFTGAVDGERLGGATVRRVIMEGEPAEAPVKIGEIKEAKVVASFCIPRTGDNAIDNAGSLPGPGATSLKGNFELIP